MYFLSMVFKIWTYAFRFTNWQSNHSGRKVYRCCQSVVWYVASDAILNWKLNKWSNIEKTEYRKKKLLAMDTQWEEENIIDPAFLLYINLSLNLTTSSSTLSYINVASCIFVTASLVTFKHYVCSGVFVHYII